MWLSLYAGVRAAVTPSLGEGVMAPVLVTLSEGSVASVPFGLCGGVAFVPVREEVWPSCPTSPSLLYFCKLK